MSAAGYIPALAMANWRTHLLGFKRTFWLGFMMFAQNFAFYIIWLIFFSAIGEIRGWRLQDVSLLFGFVCSTYGLALFFCDGPRTLANHIVEGTFDSFLTKPRPPLPMLLFSRSNASSLGDIFSGPFYWILFGDLAFSRLPFAFSLVLVSAILVTATTVIVYSLAFWLRSAGRLSDQLFEVIMFFSTTPQTGQGLALHIVIYTIIPVGFIAIMPVTLMKSFDALSFGILCAATLAYASLAVYIFNCGVKRYRRG